MTAPKPAMQKTAITIGMGMTEKQGGTDVRANTSTAERVGEGIYRLAATSGSCRRR
jgi:putative acyl-CoA dehydrogenase